MSVGRIDLDGVGSPTGIAERIHQLLPDLPLRFSIEALAKQFDIESIEEKPVTSFAAMLLTDIDKSSGSILVAEGTSRRRRRFSIAHELGHFLIDSHRPHTDAHFSCSKADLRIDDAKGADRAKRMEAEANRFAARLLMPEQRIRANLQSREPDLHEIVRLADDFDVSKAAMARSYVDAHRVTLALVVMRDGLIEQVHRAGDFPWIEWRIGNPVPSDSIAFDHGLLMGQVSDMAECDPEIWLGESGPRKVEVLSEQVMAQRGGFAMVLLYAELDD